MQEKNRKTGIENSHGTVWYLMSYEEKGNHQKLNLQEILVKTF